jgi:hypothetical protein
MSSCSVCPVGTFSASAGSSACAACAPGTYCLAGSTAPVACPAGYSCAGASVTVSGYLLTTTAFSLAGDDLFTAKATNPPTVTLGFGSKYSLAASPYSFSVLQFPAVTAPSGYSAVQSTSKKVVASFRVEANTGLFTFTIPVHTTGSFYAIVQQNFTYPTAFVPQIIFKIIPGVGGPPTFAPCNVSSDGTLKTVVATVYPSHPMTPTTIFILRINQTF